MYLMSLIQSFMHIRLVGSSKNLVGRQIVADAMLQ